MRIAILSLSCSALLGCGDDAAHPGADATSAADVEDGTSGRPDFGSGDGTAIDPTLVTVSALGDGVRRAVVVASDAERWVQLGLAAGALVEGADGWDLAFQRIAIRSAHPVAALDVPFEAVTQAPDLGSGGWVEDGATLAFDTVGPWWDYDGATHTVSPKVKTFVVAADAATYFKVAIRDYYDDAGTSGIVTLDYAPVAAPAPAATPELVRAVDDGQAIAVVAGAAARTVPEAWADVTASDTVGFAPDLTLALPGALGQTLVVRAADGAYYKVVVDGVDAATGLVLRAAPIARQPADHTIEVQAPGGGPWVYTSLRDAMSVLVADPATDPAWDLAFNGTMIRTNGGASGAGQGGAALLGEGALVDFTALAGALTPDAELPNPGPPGSGTHAGNAALEGFYDYDPATHTLTVAPRVYVVAAADGSRARLQILAYAAGTYSIAFTYAGPGHDAL